MPWAYKFHKWRRLMGVGYYEAVHTPRKVINSDLEIMEIEEAVRATGTEKANNGG